ncbi:MAG: VWA domain-containing protein [Pyrinomonadaceae bacterium]
MKHLIAFFFLLFSVGSFPVFGQVEEPPEEILKIETRLVSVPVLVSDREGRFISGLKEGDFSVFQDGVRQEIAFFADETEPINVALLLDTSYSTTEVIDRIKSAAFDFVRLLKKDDRAMVLSFDTDIKILTPLTSDRNRLNNGINTARAENVSGTVMRKTVNDVINPLFADVKGRKAIILLTDGKDFGSQISEENLLYNLEESDVLVYSVFYLTELNKFLQTDPAVVNSRIDKNNPGAGVRRSEQNLRRMELIKKNNLEATAYLNRMSDLTAGRFYERDVTDLKETFKLIVDELRKQYRIGFYPPDESEKGKVHQIRVRVKRENLAVRARKTYRSK